MKTNTPFLVLVLFLLSQWSLSAQDLHTAQAPLPCINKNFTIVAHIVRDSFGLANIAEADILENVESLNNFFAPICASFEVCEFRYIDNFQYDVLEEDDNGDYPDWAEMKIKYNQDRRINMYFIEASVGNPFCGFAALGGITVMQGAGIVILKSCVGPQSKTITHEMGHFFGLSHTFEGAGTGGSEAVDGSNCETAGDQVCDTPADPFIAGDELDEYVDVNQGCRFISTKIDPITGEYYVPDVGNIMSYYPNTCRCGFTHEQYIKMANTYLSASPKMW